MFLKLHPLVGSLSISTNYLTPPYSLKKFYQSDPSRYNIIKSSTGLYMFTT